MVLLDFIFILIVFDIYSLHFYFNVYLLYVAHVSYIIERILYGMVWYGMVAHLTLRIAAPNFLLMDHFKPIIITTS